MFALIAGRHYTATTTGKLNGHRIYHEVSLIPSRDQDPEPFVRDREGTPDQDRLFVREHGSSAPLLVVTGSIREVL